MPRRSAPARTGLLVGTCSAVCAGALVLSGCTSHGSTAGRAAGPAVVSSASVARPAATQEDPLDSAPPFGPACSDIPATGAGSLDGMATAPVATALSRTAPVSTLAAGVATAGLRDQLDTAPALTVFAPVDSAFAELPPLAVRAVMDGPTQRLSSALDYLVLPERLAPSQLTGTHRTLSGATLTVAGSGQDFVVGSARARVVCGNIQTANATVYLVDHVPSPLRSQVWHSD